MSYVLLREFDQHQAAVNAVRFTVDGSYCMTASDDRTVRLWNPHKDDPKSSVAGKAFSIQTYKGVHGYSIYDLCISKDKTKFFSAGEDKAAYLWDVSSSRVIRRIQAHNCV
jgi:mitogen-activated protein kinase organizer 1